MTSATATAAKAPANVLTQASPTSVRAGAFRYSPSHAHASARPASHRTPQRRSLLSAMNPERKGPVTGSSSRVVISPRFKKEPQIGECLRQLYREEDREDDHDREIKLPEEQM